MCAMVRRAAPYKPCCCVCLTGPLGDRDPDEARALAVDGLRTVARSAAEVGVIVALEAIHASIANDWTLVSSIPDLVEFLDEIDEPNTGMAWDLWHLWDTPDFLAHVREHAGRCVHVHLDDWPNWTPRSWADRVLPGDGVADARGFLKALDEGGYDGWIDLEIFSDDGRLGHDFPDSLWKRDPRELVAAGRDHYYSLVPPERSTA
jgi:sugar phosphate isomerase/epimerase